MSGHGLDIVESGGREAGGRDFGEVGPDGRARLPQVAGGRPALQVYFRCANAYLRVLRAADGTHYLARCPSCGKSTKFLVGEGGTDQRFFEMSCR
ncbi:MAG: hypothetical protein WC718_08685 [Phycisphaerales bacterium]|jgi:hypothetical protein